MRFSYFWHELKISSLSHSLTFVAAYEQQYALPHFCGIGEFQIFASAVQTSDKSRGVVRHTTLESTPDASKEKFSPYFH